MFLKTLQRGLTVAAIILLHAAPVAQAKNNPDFLPLMPYPQTVERAEGRLEVGAPLQFAVADRATPRVQAALQQLNTSLQQRPGVAPEASPILIRLQSLAAENSAPITAPGAELNTADEAYQLTVNGAGITLAARTDVGVLRGLATVAQLAGATGPVSLPYVVIDDAPRFAWRGLLLDSVRHFISVATIKRQIDGMAAAKLNVLHWHLTDDQGWRFESRAYPRLTELASDGEFYTRQQIKEVIAYAEARGIYVLPEVDMPGHASAIAVAYPELMSAPGPYPPEDRWGVHKPLLNPANEDVYTFAKAILQEVTELFPFGYVHIGGDEVDPEHWQNNAQIQAFMAEQNLADEQALHAYFNGRLASILTELDRAMIGWDEVLHKDLPAGTVVQSWQGPDALGRAINAGFPALLSTGFYLDQPQSSAYHYRVQLEPQPLDIDTEVHPEELWRSWRFTMPRKRGSAVAGTVSVIGSGDSLRGFVDFSGKSRTSVRDLQWQDERLSFALDSWMGPLQANLTINGDALTGPVLAANAPYSLTGELIASSERDGSELPSAIAKDIITPENRDLLLGGEAALWAEMVDEHNIDVRLWPRGFVVAERLWSSKDLRDADFMYQRLDKVSGWSAQVVGLQHVAQWRDGLDAVVPKAQQALALNVSRALEPAQYYHRHHEKSTHGTYSRRDSLKNLVDVLPAESRATQKFSADANRWLSDTDNTAALVAAQAQLSSWQKDAKALRALLEHNDPANLLSVTQTLQQVSEWGLTILTAQAEGKPLSDDERSRAYRELQQAMQIQDEMIVAPARVVMSWLAH